MQHSSLKLTVRATALVVAILFSGAAFAAQKNSSDEAKADCANRALIQFNIDDATCYNFPAYTELFGNCKSQAVAKYGQALAACSTATKGTRPLGATVLNSDGKLTTTVAPNVRAM